MNRFIIILFVTLLFVQCSSMNVIKQKAASVPKQDSEELPEWQLYSTALYYKSVKDYKKAIRYLLDAVTYGKELHRVYYQLAECYYLLFDYDTSINFANMSIERDRKFTNPYLLIHRIYINLKNFNESARILEKLIEERPELVEIHFRLGIHYYTKIKNYDKSLAYFKNIIELSKTIPIADYYIEYANYYIGYIYYHKNQINRSVEYLKKTVEVNPDNNSAIYILSKLLMHNYQLDDAEKYILMYLSRFPDNQMMNSYMGRIDYINNNPRATLYLGKAMHSKSIDSLIARALYLEILKRDEAAKKYFTLILKKNPRFISPHIGLARIALRNNDKKTAFNEFLTASLLLYKVKLYNSARENLIKVLSINDKIPEIYFYLGKIYEETGNISLAIVNYKKTNELSPKTDIIVHVGYLYSEKNDFDKAIKYFDIAIKKEPKNPKPYFIKGIVYSKKKNYPLAEKYIKKAIEINESDTYYFYLAMIQEKHKKLNDAIDSLKKAIRVNSKNARAYNFLGYLYADNNMNIEESITLIKTALKFEPLNGAYLDSLGWAYYRKGKYDLALKKLLKAEKQLEMDKAPDPVVFDHIADTYEKMGNHEKAIEYWEKSLKIKRDPKIIEKINISKKHLKGIK
jgi:tetratricopeptide (TPR) repeat protein